MFASEHKPWFEVYRAAMLELDSERLPERIVAAKEALRLRLKEIQGDTDHHAERQQIEDALSSLRTLEREQNWRDLAAAASAETDPEKLGKLIEELCSALDKRQARK